MRYTLLIAISLLGLTACNKDKYTTTPQIKFKSIEPDVYRVGQTTAPILTITVTDSEGDLGIRPGNDTAFVYVLDPRTSMLDSFPMPDISTASVKNFEAEVRIDMKQSIRPITVPDTLYYDIYIRDFAKNKSNVMRTEKPIYYLP